MTDNEIIKTQKIIKLKYNIDKDSKSFTIDVFSASGEFLKKLGVNETVEAFTKKMNASGVLVF